MPALIILSLCLALAGCTQSKTAFDARAYERNVERTANDSFNQRLQTP